MSGSLARLGREAVPSLWRKFGRPLRCSGHVHGLALSFRRDFGTSEQAKQLINSSDSKHLVLMSEIQPYKGNVTIVAGPSRQGKSHLMDLLVGHEIFGVSHDPMSPMTFGAWYHSSDKDLFVDTEGQSHAVTDATARLFSAIYPLSQNLIWSDKALGDDKFFEMMENLSAKMEDYKEGESKCKPRLVLVIRDCSFEFKDRDTGDDIGCDAYVKKYIAPRLDKHRLFTEIRGVALEDLKNSIPGSSPAEDALKALRNVLSESHEGPLIKLTDKESMQLLIKVVNKKGFFDLSEMTTVLLDSLGPFRDATSCKEENNAILAERFGWDAEKMSQSFKTACKNIENHCRNFPSQYGKIEQDILVGLRQQMEVLTTRVKNKQMVVETETQEHTVPYERVQTVDDGGHTGTGCGIGAIGGGAALVGLATMVTGPVGLACALAMPAVCSATGAFLGDKCRATKQITVKDTKVVKAHVEKNKGYKLGTPE